MEGAEREGYREGMGEGAGVRCDLNILSGFSFFCNDTPYDRV